MITDIQGSCDSKNPQNILVKRLPKQLNLASTPFALGTTPQQALDRQHDHKILQPPSTKSFLEKEIPN